MGMGIRKAAVKQDLLQLSESKPLDHLILGGEEKEQCFSDFRHTPYIVTWKERSSPLILIPVCHWKVALMSRTLLLGLLSLRLLYTSAAFKRSCSAGQYWKERVSGPIHVVAWGEHDPVKAECRGRYWSPVRNLNCCPLVICCS